MDQPPKHKKRKVSKTFQSRIIGNKRYKILRLFFIRERNFLSLLMFLFIIAGVFYPYPKIAMWVGFAFAGYSAIANDSIQTIGTFLSSNADRKWWQLWLFIAGIFALTATYSWVTYGGDVSFERLTKTPAFAQAPQSFAFLQLAAPLILLLLTRLRMPVSTTFLLLSAFSSDSSGIIGMTQKSLGGYFVAFFTAIIVWLLAARIINAIVSADMKYYNVWRIAQWIISGILWSVWIMQDAANIAVFLPRSLSFWQFFAFVSYIFFGLGILFYLRGDKIQKVITEKSDITDVRGATIIDLVYASILYFFKTLSNIPMSTTWVFIGLLGGRELSMSLSKSYTKKNSIGKSIRLIGKDIFFAFIGMLVSILLAIAVNPVIQREVLNFFSGE